MYRIAYLHKYILYIFFMNFIYKNYGISNKIKQIVYHNINLFFFNMNISIFHSIYSRKQKYMYAISFSKYSPQK